MLVDPACGAVRCGAGRVQGGGRRGLAPPGPRRPAAPAPAWAPPRGSCAHRAALAPKCVTGTGRAPQAARARLASGQCGPDQGSRAVSGAGAASRKALGLRGPRAPVGRTLRRAARQEPASAVVGRAKATLSLRPPALLPPARRQRRFPPGETTRILPGAPRPARSPPPPPGWGAGVGPRGGGGSGSPSQEVAGGGGAPLVTHSPCHVTRSSAQRPHARPGPAPRRAAHHAPAGTRAPAARAPARAASRPPQAGRAAGAAPAALLLHRPGLLQRNRRAHGLLR